MTRKSKTKRKQLDFEDWYEIAKKYYEEHGDLLVPRIYEDEEGHKLGRWIERLRAFYNGNPKIKVALTQMGIVMLEKIGMVWKKGKYMSNDMQMFLNFTQRYYKEHPLTGC